MKAHKKRIASPVYTLKTNPKTNKEVLFAKGIYPTKLIRNDLPLYFYSSFRYGRRYYIDAKHVKRLLYKPNYVFDNHFLKDDFLYVSYGNEIVEQTTDDGRFRCVHGYDHVFCGGDIIWFLLYVREFSSYDIMSIQKQICDKYDWLIQRNPDLPEIKTDIRTYFSSEFRIQQP